MLIYMVGFGFQSTLTFAIAAMSNVVSYISDYLNDKAGEWTYEFTKVTVGAVTISIYVTVVPVLACGCV